MLLKSTGTFVNALENLKNAGSPETWSGVTNSLGGMVNNVTGTTANNAFNAEEAQKQRDWEERMSNTQYQRTVADMKAAGINPASLMSGAQLTSMGSSQAATSGSGSNLLGTILNALVGFAKGRKGGSKVTINKYYQ